MYLRVPEGSIWRLPSDQVGMYSNINESRLIQSYVIWNYDCSNSHKTKTSPHWYSGALDFPAYIQPARPFITDSHGNYLLHR